MTRTDEIRERCEKTTRGKWKLEKCEHGAAIYTVPTNSTFGIKHNIALEGAEATDEDMIFIAHAREDIPWLVAENAKKDAEITRLEAERDAAVADLMEAGYCFTCRKNNASQCPYRDEDYEPPYPWDDPHRSDEAIDCYEWRGIQAATGAEEGGAHD